MPEPADAKSGDASPQMPMRPMTICGLAGATILGAMLALAGCIATGGEHNRFGVVSGDADQRPPPGQAWVIFGTDTVTAEVAATPDARERGLMGRTRVPDGSGMLFVFPEARERSFWMRDVRVGLDVAFFDDRNRIIGIRQMNALDERLTDSPAPVSLALEVRQGWFRENGIAEGCAAAIVFGPGLDVRQE